jgi:hypothetical protein
MNKEKLIEILKENEVNAWEDFFSGDDSVIEDGSDAGAVTKQDDVPEFFVFDTAGFLDLLSAIDVRLLDELDGDAYHSEDTNLAGALIGEIESRLPLSDEFKKRLEESREEMEK